MASASFKALATSRSSDVWGCTYQRCSRSCQGWTSRRQIERFRERPIAGPETVLQLAEAIGPRWRALILLAGFAGLRLGELLGLRRRHINLDAATVTVSEQIVTLEGGRRLVSEPKTEAGRRNVVVPRVVVDALSVQIKYLPHDPESLLFPSESD